MANWQRKFTMADVWDSEDLGLIANTAADRLEALEEFPEYPFVDRNKEILIKDLRKLAKKKNLTPQQFDVVWEKVYNWADIPLDREWNGKKVCFIRTW